LVVDPGAETDSFRVFPMICEPLCWTHLADHRVVGGRRSGLQHLVVADLRHHAGMDVEQLIARHPRVFHTMSANAWPPMQQHGLLSTQRLIDLFGLDAVERDRLLSAPRKQSTILRAPGMPPAVIRDQKPMKFVAEKIDPDSSPAEYLAAVDSRVFFWATPLP
jgi:hypothetical protein